MAKIFGLVTENKKPVEFATVFRSDANGKPVGNLATTTDDKGRWQLDGLLPTDYVTARMIGLEPSTISVSKAVNMPDLITGIPMTILNIPIKQSASATLDEVVVTAEKPKSPTPKDRPTPKQTTTTTTTPPPPPPPKKGMSKALKIGLIVGGSLLLLIIVGVIIHQSTKDKK